MRIALLVLTLLACRIQISAQSCISDTILIEQGDANPYTSLSLNNDDCQFQFAVVTDRTGGHRPGVFLKGIKKVNLLQPEFVLSVGDLIEGYTEDMKVLENEWAEFEGFIDSLEMPFFYVPGNHDITNKVMEDLWIEKFGKTYYHFLYKDVLFLCLNSEDQIRGAGRGTLSDEQYNYVEQVLSDNPDVRWTFVFLHQPLWIQDDPKRWPDVESLLSQRQHTVFAGHYHHYVKRERNNGNYIMLATTGGGSGLRGNAFGEFDHFVWVTMTDDGPVLANLMLDGVATDAIATNETEAYFQSFLDKQSISFQPHFTGSESFSVKLSNHKDFPIDIKIKEGFGWDYWYTVDQHEIHLEPNTVQILEGGFTQRNSDMNNRATPIHFTVEATLPSGKTMSMPVSYNIKPLTRKSIPMIGVSTKIDGLLDENIELTETLEIEGQTIAKFGVAQTSDLIVMQAKIMDDNIQIDTTASPWRQDALGVQFHFGSKETSVQANRSEHYLMLSPASSDMASTIARPDRLPEDWNYICTVVEGGYNFECTIPKVHLTEAQGDNWESLRINLTVADKDAGKDEIDRHWWNPEWRSEDSWVGSGLFFNQ